MLSQGSILIIDDKIEDGQPISDQLKELCIPHLFFHADLEKIRAISENKPEHIQHVRVVFQDINLTDSGSPGTSDYEIAVTAIENLLPANNGPWLLATWSTYADDGGVSYAELLFRHLVENLPCEQRPFGFVTLDKAKFTGGETHGRVTKYTDMSDEQRGQLATEVIDSVKSKPAMSALMEWERSVSKAVSKSIADLHSLSNFGADHDESMGRLLLELSKAEAGKSLTDENARNALTKILNGQLLSRVVGDGGGALCITSYADTAPPENAEKWARQVNSLLHLNPGDTSGGPGSLFTFGSFKSSMANLAPPLDVHSDQIEPWKSYITDDFIRKNFLESVTNVTHSGFVDLFLPIILEAPTIIIDVTPPCDHAQAKAECRTFCGGLLVSIPELSRTMEKNFKSSLLSPDFLWNSCHFYVESGEQTIENAMFFFNSRLTFFGPDIESFNSALEAPAAPKFGEQITKDFVHWLKSQESRPGYTSMR